MIARRRDIHQNPELGNREVRTSSLVAEHLKRLGYEVHEKVAKTGVVAILKGGKPGPKSGGAEAEVEWRMDGYIPVVNNIPLTQRMVPTLKRATGTGRLLEAPRVTGSEDFSFFARQVPGLYFFVGVTAPDTPPLRAAPNHSPRFRIDEAGLMIGLRSMLHLAFDYLDGTSK